MYQERIRDHRSLLGLPSIDIHFGTKNQNIWERLSATEKNEAVETLMESSLVYGHELDAETARFLLITNNEAFFSAQPTGLSDILLLAPIPGNHRWRWLGDICSNSDNPKLIREAFEFYDGLITLTNNPLLLNILFKLSQERRFGLLKKFSFQWGNQIIGDPEMTLPLLLAALKSQGYELTNYQSRQHFLPFQAGVYQDTRQYNVESFPPPFKGFAQMLQSKEQNGSSIASFAILAENK
ncbi:MAG: hypothetical protein PVJ09_01310 [Candidatus Woesebacteria bacterium]|jgi:hypothetical protein